MISVPRIAIASVKRRPRVAGYQALLMASALLFVGACQDETPADPVVVGTIEVSPRISTARVGTTQQLTAAAFSPSGAAMSGETYKWSSSEPTVATVTDAGLVTFVGSGSTAILATARGTSGFATIVSEANVATVQITASALTLPLGQTRQVTAKAYDAAGVSQFRPITWASSSPSVATVSASGLITSVSQGTTTITATSESKVGSISFTVLPPAPVATVTLTPDYRPVAVGTTYPLTLTLRDVDNGVLSNRVVVWTTSNSAIATVSSTGVVTGVANGLVIITATSEGKSGTTHIGITGAFDSALADGVGVVFDNTATGTSKMFAIYVPPGATNLNVVMTGSNGDPDLYVYPPGSNTAACASETGGSTVSETCNVANPVSGVWFIESYAYSPHTATTVKATVTK